MKRRAAVAIAGFGGTLLGLGAVASCGSRTGLPLDETADAEPEHGLISPDRFAEEPEQEDATDVVAEEVLPGIDVNRPDVPVFNPCPDAAATLIYVMSESNVLYSFNPGSNVFTTIGTISCPGAGMNTPFSMAVDREGVAYVVFTPSGELYRVSTKTAECTTTKYRGMSGLTFGMGFVANVGDAGVDGGGGETLYVSETLSGKGVLATIDTNTFVLSTIGPYSSPVQMAELTGTGGGQLYAFQPFIPMMTTGSFIYNIDPKTAKVLAGASLPGIQAGAGWAFGFWGGDFYTFTAPPPGNTTVVDKYDPKAMMIRHNVAAISDVIVGAGVSTCAPTGGM